MSTRDLKLAMSLSVQVAPTGLMPASPTFVASPGVSLYRSSFFNLEEDLVAFLPESTKKTFTFDLSDDIFSILARYHISSTSHRHMASTIKSTSSEEGSWVLRRMSSKSLFLLTGVMKNSSMPLTQETKQLNGSFGRLGFSACGHFSFNSDTTLPLAFS